MEFDQTHHKKLRTWYLIPAGYIPFELIASSLILFAESHGPAFVWHAATCADDDVSAHGHSVLQLQSCLVPHARYFARHILVTIRMVERSNMSVTCPIPAVAWMLNSLHSFFAFLRFFLCVTSIFLLHRFSLSFLPSSWCTTNPSFYVREAPALNPDWCRVYLEQDFYVCPRYFDGNIHLAQHPLVN